MQIEASNPIADAGAIGPEFAHWRDRPDARDCYKPLQIWPLLLAFNQSFSRSVILPRASNGLELFDLRDDTGDTVTHAPNPALHRKGSDTFEVSSQAAIL